MDGFDNLKALCAVFLPPHLLSKPKKKIQRHKGKVMAFSREADTESTSFTKPPEIQSEWKQGPCWFTSLSLSLSPSLSLFQCVCVNAYHKERQLYFYNWILCLCVPRSVCRPSVELEDGRPTQLCWHAHVKVVSLSTSSCVCSSLGMSFRVRQCGRCGESRRHVCLPALLNARIHACQPVPASPIAYVPLWTDLLWRASVDIDERWPDQLPLFSVSQTFWSVSNAYI